MTLDPVHFETIEVHRAMGIARGKGFSLTELSAGVNLIVGPNGSGKSTTARVIQELLWPGRTGLERPSVAGRFSNGQDSCQIDIDAGHCEVLRNGKAASIPEFGPPENRRRYYLPLYELLHDENSDFAKVIADKSQGGFDLEEAAKKLGFRERMRSRNRESQTLRELYAKVADAKRRQKELQGDFAHLAQLHKEYSEALDAEVEIDLLKLAVQYHEASNSCNQAKVKLESFPDEIALLHGDERRKLDELAARAEELQREETSEQTRCKDSERTLREVSLPDGGVTGEVFRNLKGWQQSLKDIESDIRHEQQRLVEVRSTLESVQRRLGKHISPDQVKQLHRIEIEDVSAFARKVHRIRGQKHALEEKWSFLSAELEEDEQPLNGQRLRDGMTSLSSWLASPTQSQATAKRGRYLPTVLVATAIACMSLVLAFYYHWAWSFALLLAVAVVGAGWWIGRGETGRLSDNPRHTYQQSYLALGIEPPQEWDDSSVRNQLFKLVDLVVVQARREDRNEQIKDIKTKFSAYKREAAELEEEQATLEDQLGLDIKHDQEWLPLLVDNLARWQGSNDAVDGAEQRLSHLEQQRREILEEINLSLSEFGYERVESAETAIQAVGDLENRATRYRDAYRQQQDARRRIEHSIVPALRKLSAQKAAILESLRLAPDQEFMIDEWMKLRPEYLAFKQKLSNEEAILGDRRVALAGREDLFEIDLSTIKEQLEILQAKSDSRDDLMSRIAEINQQVEAAKSGFELSTALEALDAAKVELERARDENCRSVIGARVAEFVRKEAIERSRPEVFQRANQLLIKFTKGTLQLELEDQKATPCFQARSATGRSRPLNELSSGERIHLLIAIRIAFLEYDERARLPLLLDEALGTTDDERIGVIIDSVIELARDDRQIFYFTAQQDEVAKWRSHMDQAGISYTVIDLRMVRRMAAAKATPLEITPLEPIPPVAPNGMSYEEYGRALGVPGLDPLQDNIDGIHLWHVLDDTECLHNLLEKQIVNWGQLQLLVDHGGKELIDLTDGRLERAVAAAAAIHSAFSAWRVGRGKTVDRSVLSDSGSVSDAFIDKVSGLAHSLGGDAQALIEALEEGDVSRWRSTNTESLTEYLESNGFLTNQTPLSLGEIRIRVLARVANEVTQGLISESLIDRIVGSLPA